MAAEHFFSSDRFLTAVADVYFPNATPEMVSFGPVTARALVVGGKAVSGFWHFPYSIRPAPDYAGATRAVPFLQSVAVGETELDTEGPNGAAAAPFIDWTGFESWERYEQYAHGRGARTSSLTRDERSLSAVVGLARYTADDDDPAAFEATMRWKSAQYQRENGADRYSVPRNIEFFRVLRERRLLSISTLRAGDRLAATIFSHRWAGTYIARVMTYDVELAAYSPGAILLRHALRDSLESGEREFDFMLGREPYKYLYATHIRWLAHVGKEPRMDRWRRVGRMRASRLARAHPRLGARLRTAETLAQRLLPGKPRR